MAHLTAPATHPGPSAPTTPRPSAGLAGPRALARRYPLTAYFTLTFALSWGGILLVIGGPHAIPASTEDAATLFPLVYLAMLTGPSIAGLVMTGLVDGAAGFRALAARLTTWRAGARWWTMALFTAPVVTLALLLPLSLASPTFVAGIFTTTSPGATALAGLAIGLGAGVFEELGWTGFATPHLRRRFPPLATGLIVGIPWGAWHFLANGWGIGTSAGPVPLAAFLPAVLFSFLPAYRVLMVWVHDHTQSLLVAMLMHASLTASLLILGPLEIAGGPLVLFDTLLAAALWMVAIVALRGAPKAPPADA